MTGCRPSTATCSPYAEPAQKMSSRRTTFSAQMRVMPEASQANLDDLDRAVEILTVDMTADQRLTGDDFKLALYQTASVILHTKALDTNGDGQLTLDEILNLSSGNAARILGPNCSERIAAISRGDMGRESYSEPACVST